MSLESVSSFHIMESSINEVSSLCCDTVISGSSVNFAHTLTTPFLPFPSSSPTHESGRFIILLIYL